MSLNGILTELEFSILIKAFESEKDYRVSDGIRSRTSYDQLIKHFSSFNVKKKIITI